ncbi:carbohydrate-binding protein [Marinobacter subterrani]|uniref:carbohydrate-binding protein n=1 Tax=Marinobacter subterrani TaxID=1658765 RepID=UPI002353169F|nr:carbohydrate-binding protein [Marinobacter subterrani]
MTESVRQALGKGFATLLLLAVALTTAAAPCDPEQAGWVPSKYYPAGSVVFYQGDWFESRTLQEGKEPGSAFDWKRLASAPDCGARAANASGTPAANAPKAGTSGQPPAPGQDEVQALCEPPEPWLFSRSYLVGSLARHGGKVWEAIRPTHGDMPGIAEPPHWKPVPDHCSVKDQ